MPRQDHRPSEAENPAGGERTDEQLQRVQRLENMGLLATRVAHDLNNMLAPMKLAIPMLRPSVSDPTASSLLDSMETTMSRATALVRQILEYAHGAGGRLELVLIQQLLEEIAVFARETFPRTIHVDAHIPAGLWLINANLSQIHQVLLNLCVNAREAMPRGGMLTLRAENCLLDSATASEIDGGRAGAFLVLQVDDTGTGFSPSVMAKMWEPFVTTKEANRGTGLGLSTIREIIVHHGGFIHLNTAMGKGSSFRIYLPAAATALGKPELFSQQKSRPLVDSPR